MKTSKIKCSGNRISRLLLFLLILCASGGGKAWGATAMVPQNGTTVLTNGDTYTNIMLGSNGATRPTGTYTIIVDGTTTIEGYTPYNYIGAKDAFFNRGALLVAKGQKLIIKGTGRLIAKTKIAFWQSNSKNYGDLAYPAIDIEPGGEVVIDGLVAVEAEGKYHAGGEGNLSAPGVGGRRITGGDAGGGTNKTAGSLTLKNGASFSTDYSASEGNNSLTHATAQLPLITVENYACVTTPDYNYYKRMDNDNSNTKYYVRSIYYTGLDKDRPNADTNNSLSIEGMTSPLNFRITNKYSDFTIYFVASSFPQVKSQDYGTINGIPFPLDKSSDKVKTVALGIARGRNSNNLYASLNRTFSEDINLNVNNYPSTGTLKTSAAITFYGDNKKLNTTADGLTLNAATDKPILLSGITTTDANTKLIIDGPVLLYRNSSGNISTNSINDNVLDKAGNQICYYKATVNGMISGTTFNSTGAVTTDKVATDNYYYDTSGSNVLYIWVKRGSNIVTKATIANTANVRYTGTTNLASHTIAGNFYPTDFDVHKGSVTASTLNGFHTVNYSGNKYSIQADASIWPITYWTSQKAADKQVLCNNGFNGNIILDAMTIENNSSIPLLIENGVSATVTVSGTNVFTTQSDGVEVKAGGSLKILGDKNATSSLKLTGGSSSQDLLNNGTLNVNDGFTLTAANGRMRPNLDLADGSSIILGTTPYFQARLNEKLENISSINYSDGTPFNSDYHAIYGNYNRFWIPGDKLGVSFRTKDGVLTQAAATTELTQHNIALDMISVIASIGNIAYPSLKAAFDAVKNDETIQLETTYSLTQAEKMLTTAKLTVGQKANFNLGTFTLTVTDGTVLSSGAGVLTLQKGTGQISGTYRIDGCLYTTLNDGLGTPTLDGSIPVYRTSVSGFPTNVSNPIAYKWGNTYYKAYTDGTTACLWLPAGPLEISVADQLTNEKEDVSTASYTVQTNHSTNITTASPLLDIGKASITINKEASSNNIKVSYGKKPYEAVLDVGTTAAKRLTVYGKATADNGQDNQLLVDAGGINPVYITLKNIEVRPNSKVPVLLKSAADIELSGDNRLTGASPSNGVLPAIDVQAGLTLRSEESGMGRLYATGGLYGSIGSPAIKSTGSTDVTIAGGTYIFRHGSDQLGKDMEGEPYPVEVNSLKILAGSVDARSKTQPVNTKGTTVYRVSITTGLNPDQPYRMDYKEVLQSANRLVLPDAAGKAYAWMPKQDAATDGATNVDFFNPANNVTTPIQVVEVNTDDKNVAPIVARLTNRKTHVSTTYGNLSDAFTALEAGSATDHNVYDMSLLAHIYNLSTLQTVPANTDVYLDLGVSNIEAQNGSPVSFDASASGAYLNVVGKGNMKGTFRVNGDVFITQQVPLTDAVVIKNNLSVFRVLLNNPVLHQAGNSYKYTYSGQSETFFVHDGQACLWLPSRENTELRMVLTVQGGSSTEYTAGNITTSTQRTDLIDLTPLNVVARLTYTDTNSSTVDRPCKTLQEAFTAVAALDPSIADAEVRLLRSESVSGTLKASGSFTFNLDGKNLTSASGGLIEVAAGTKMTVTDLTSGTKGTMQIDINIKGGGVIHIASVVRLTGNMYKDADKSHFFWRTLLNMSYQPADVATVGYDGSVYPVIDREVCLWLPAATEKEYDFTLNNTGSPQKTTGIIVAGKHDNELTLGGTNNVARVGETSYEKLADAFAAAQSANLPVQLLKTFNLPADYIIPASTFTLELGKYELGGTNTLTVPANATLIVRSTGGVGGKLTVPLKLADASSIVYIGKTVVGDGIGKVTGTSNHALYRLLVDGLPANIPTGTHAYTFINSTNTSDKQTGQFRVLDGVGCLWLEQVNTRDKLEMLSPDYAIPNIALNPDHFNTQTYGVDMVAQIRNGASYDNLETAFGFGANQTISLLKNASLKSSITVNGSIVFEMGGFTVTPQNGEWQFTIPDGSNLRITGRGTLKTAFAVQPVIDYTTYSNYNLQVDKEVVLSSAVNGNLYRVFVSGGLPSNQRVKYTFGGGDTPQTGKVKTSADGTLCLWMSSNSTPSNFLLDLPDLGETYLATQVVVQNHTSISVVKVGAVAMIGETPYDNLETAVATVSDGQKVVLHKDLESQTEPLALADGKKATLDLSGLSIKGKALPIKAGAGSQLLMTNGTLSGGLLLTGNVFAAGDVEMTMANVSLAGGGTVWRTLVTLPGTVASFSYKLGDKVSGTSTNVRTTTGTSPATTTACLWLPSSNIAQTFTVTIDGQEQALNNVIIASTHGNELDLTGDNKPVAQDGNNVQYASLASALAVGTGTITLLKDVNLASVQAIARDMTFDLGGHTITSGNGGFSVPGGNHTLTLQNSKTAGMLTGTFRLTGDGRIVAGKTVKIAGIVLDSKNDEIYRVMLAADNTENCRWLRPSLLEYDETWTGNGSTEWQATIPARLENHNTVITAYKHIVLNGTQSWNDNYANTNLELSAGATLNVSGLTSTKEIHRLTIHDGALVAVEAGSQVRAVEGIRYIRRFDAGKWGMLALPFSPVRTTADDENGKPYLLNPAYDNGTSGHFWLKTVDTEGKLQTVASAELTANIAYLMAVPGNLDQKALTFVSGANQLLRRDKVLAVKPTVGFAAYANGTFNKVLLTEVAYTLSADGSSFERQTMPEVDPFRGYLLADAATTNSLSSLKLSVPTANETIAPAPAVPFHVYGLEGRIMIDAFQPETIWIHQMDGRCIRVLRVNAGRTEVLLNKNMYIVNRTKVIVR